MIVNIHRTHTSRSSRIEHVARLQSEELADETYQTVNPKQHVARATLLDGLPVDVKMEMQRLYIKELFFRYPLSYCSSTIKPLAQVPRLTSIAQSSLKVARGEVDAHRHGIVIPVAEGRAR